jgi:hypothetical protein
MGRVPDDRHFTSTSEMSLYPPVVIVMLVPDTTAKERIVYIVGFDVCAI